MTRTYRISSEELAPEAAAELHRLVEDAGLLGPVDTIEDAVSAADAFIYTITVESGDRRTTLTTSDDAAPDAIRALLAWLSRASRVRHQRSEEE